MYLFTVIASINQIWILKKNTFCSVDQQNFGGQTLWIHIVTTWTYYAWKLICSYQRNYTPQNWHGTPRLVIWWIVNVSPFQRDMFAMFVFIAGFWTINSSFPKPRSPHSFHEPDLYWPKNCAKYEGRKYVEEWNCAFSLGMMIHDIKQTIMELPFELAYSFPTHFSFSKGGIC